METIFKVGDKVRLTDYSLKKLLDYGIILDKNSEYIVAIASNLLSSQIYNLSITLEGMILVFDENGYSIDGSNNIVVGHANKNDCNFKAGDIVEFTDEFLNSINNKPIHTELRIIETQMEDGKPYNIIATLLDGLGNKVYSFDNNGCYINGDIVAIKPCNKFKKFKVGDTIKLNDYFVTNHVIGNDIDNNSFVIQDGHDDLYPLCIAFNGSSLSFTCDGFYNFYDVLPSICLNNSNNYMTMGDLLSHLNEMAKENIDFNNIPVDLVINSKVITGFKKEDFTLDDCDYYNYDSDDIETKKVLVINKHIDDDL